MYNELFNQMKKQLRQLDTWIGGVAAYADSKKFDGENFFNARLIADQLPFARQVHVACDTAKLAVSRLTGKDAPKHDDSEKTLADLRGRIQSTLAYLDTFTAADFASAATRSITQPRWEGKTMTGHDYFLEHAVPNFFFHVTTAYSILRANGVPIGKKDYLGPLTQHAPK